MLYKLMLVVLQKYSSHTSPVVVSVLSDGFAVLYEKLKCRC
jgi:hypothetical protein